MVEEAKEEITSSTPPVAEQSSDAVDQPAAVSEADAAASVQPGSAGISGGEGKPDSTPDSKPDSTGSISVLEGKIIRQVEVLR